MQGLIGPLKELAEFEELCKNKKKDVGMIRVCGCRLGNNHSLRRL